MCGRKHLTPQPSNHRPKSLISNRIKLVPGFNHSPLDSRRNSTSDNGKGKKFITSHHITYHNAYSSCILSGKWLLERKSRQTPIVPFQLQISARYPLHLLSRPFPPPSASAPVLILHPFLGISSCRKVKCTAGWVAILVVFYI